MCNITKIEIRIVILNTIDTGSVTMKYRNFVDVLKENVNKTYAEIKKLHF